MNTSSLKAMMRTKTVNMTKRGRKRLPGKYPGRRMNIHKI